jgi:uncharacterized coiled-coil DUF342 family protein
MIDTETIADKVISQIQDLDKKLEMLLLERSSLKSDVEKLKNERDEIRTEIDRYLKELQEIKAGYVDSNNNN